MEYLKRFERKTVKNCFSKLVRDFFYLVQNKKPSITWQVKIVLGDQTQDETNCRDNCSSFLQNYLEKKENLGDIYDLARN